MVWPGIWNTTDRRSGRRFRSPTAGPVRRRGFAFSPRRHAPGSPRSWGPGPPRVVENARTGAPVTPPASATPGRWTLRPRFSADGHRASPPRATTRTARIWDAVTGKAADRAARPRRRGQIGRVQPRRRAAWSPRAGTTPRRVWDAVTGKPLTEPLGHGRPRSPAAAFHPGRPSASSPRAGTATGAGCGKRADRRADHTGRSCISAASPPRRFSPDGTRVVTASDGHHRAARCGTR